MDTQEPMDYITPEEHMDIQPKHYCQQCKKEMGNEWLLGAVCGKCCRKNHKRVTGRKK